MPGVAPSGAEITIRQLLAHRSGLANITDFPAWLDQVSRSPATRPVDTLRYAASQPMAFAPGAEWGYSNTNYIALGLVIEKVTGDSYRQQLEKRILEPLRLDDTQLPRARQVDGLDDAGENPNVPWAAGALVSTTRDLARFFSALLSGDVVSESSLAAMKERIVVDRGLRLRERARHLLERPLVRARVGSRRRHPRLRDARAGDRGRRAGRGRLGTRRRAHGRAAGRSLAALPAGGVALSHVTLPG